MDSCHVLFVPRTDRKKRGIRRAGRSWVGEVGEVAVDRVHMQAKKRKKIFPEDMH